MLDEVYPEVRRRFVRHSLSVEAGWQGRRLPGSSSDRWCLRRGT